MTPIPAPRQPSLFEHPGAAWLRIPAWPDTLIAPVDRELARWTQLWKLPQATLWTRRGQQRAVATMVRLEQRCHQATRPSARYATELGLLRRELGLTLA